MIEQLGQEMSLGSGSSPGLKGRSFLAKMSLLLNDITDRRASSRWSKVEMQNLTCSVLSL